MEQDKDQNQDNERRNTYLKNRIWRVGFGDGLVERCSLPGYEDIEAEENAKIRQHAEDIRNGVREPGITTEDIIRANEQMMKQGTVSLEELQARNDITIVTPFGTFKHNFLPTPEDIEAANQKMINAGRAKKGLPPL